MTKIRKVKRKKKYRFNVNRKRMNKKRLPNLEHETIKDAWNPHTSSEKNFKKMGLVFDLNKDIKSMNSTNEKDKAQTKIQNIEEPATVIDDLSKDAKLAKKKNFKLPIGQVKFLTYMMDKYGNDFKAMSRDKKNYLQQTWKQLRSKINTFKKISEQYNEYLSKRDSNH